MGDLDRDFIVAKAYSLLHDPPYKSWFFKWLLEDKVRHGHEKEAEEARNSMLKGTFLERPEKVRLQDIVEIVKKADRVASSFDRWLLGPYEKAKYLLYYEKIHNIFHPGISRELVACEELKDFKAFKGKFSESVASRLNSILRRAQECLKGPGEYGTVLRLYALLYSLLEPLYYSEGLPASLADTRAPTHTTFDHLYATASTVNMVWGSPGRGFKGYLALVDVPGTLHFVLSARRAGDYWAGSWLLSNAMWRLVKGLVERLGPDVVLAPTLRFNPYFYNWVVDELRKEGCNSLAEEVEGILGRFLAKLVGSPPGGVLELGELKKHPLLPATALFVLPKTEDWSDVNSVEEDLRKRFDDAWRGVVEELLGEGARGDSVVKAVVKALLEGVRYIVDKPPAGVRVRVVDLGEVYRGLVDCMGKGGSCEEHGIAGGPLRKALEKLMGGSEYSIEGIAEKIAFHVAIRSMEKAKPRKIPALRPFWKLKGLNGGGYALEMVEGGIEWPEVDEGWVHCTICGVEPAIVRLRKRPGQGAGAYGEYNYDDLGKLCEKLGYAGSEKDKKQECMRRLTHLFKAGEALGPYCLLKRITYHLKRGSLNLRFYSTDDVALYWWPGELGEYVKNKLGRSFEDTLKQRLSEVSKDRGMKPEQQGIETALLFLGAKEAKGAKDEAMFRDIELASRNFTVNGRNVTVEEFIDMVDESLRMIARDLAYKLANKLAKEGGAGREFVGIATKPAGVYKALEEEKEESMGKAIDKLKGVEGLVEGFGRISKLRTRYLIVYADGDDIGGIHLGVLPGLKCDEYVDYIVRGLEEASKVRSGNSGGLVGGSRELLEDLKSKFKLMCELGKALGTEGVLVSPTLKAALSASLMVVALKDSSTLKDLGACLIYAGGDDVLALAPPDSLQGLLGLRANYRGDGYFHVLKGKCLEGSPIAPAIPFGRSLSVRVASLFDLMNEEISEAHEALKSIAKGRRWSVAGGKGRLAKDTLVITHSRSKAIAALPLTRPSGSPGGEGLEAKIAEMLVVLYLCRLTGLLSAGLPEDLETLTRGHHDILSKRPERLRKLLGHVILRNIDVRRGEESGKRRVYELVKCIAEDEGIATMVDEDSVSASIRLVEAYRILRGLP